MSEIQEGEIVQCRPDLPMFGGCMVTVSEVKAWGVQGYVQSAGVEGQQYIRINREDFERTGGMAVWVAGSLADKAAEAEQGDQA